MLLELRHDSLRISNKNFRYRGGNHCVSDFGTNQKLICDFLLVINTNLHPILHCFQVGWLLVKFSLATGVAIFYIHLYFITSVASQKMKLT